MNTESKTPEQPKESSLFSLIAFARWIAAIVIVTLLTVATDGISSPIWWFSILSLVIYGIASHLAGFKKGAQFGFEDGMKIGFKKGMEQGAGLGSMLQGLSDAMTRMANGEEPTPKKKEVINPQEELNRILDKISFTGMDSLSPQEKELLNKLTK